MKREVPFVVIEASNDISDLDWTETETHVTTRDKQGHLVFYANKKALVKIKELK